MSLATISSHTNTSALYPPDDDLAIDASRGEIIAFAIESQCCGMAASCMIVISPEMGLQGSRVITYSDRLLEPPENLVQA